MKHFVRLTSAVIFCLWAAAGLAFAHCEIPCGIYDDEARFKALEEDILTVEKSMQQIEALSKDPVAHANQLVRWVNNKEHHADHIRDIVAQYFLSQRVKPESPEYAEQLRVLHAILLQAVKAKQTTDQESVSRLRKFIKEFRDLYAQKNEPGNGKSKP